MNYARFSMLPLLFLLTKLAAAMPSDSLNLTKTIGDGAAKTDSITLHFTHGSVAQPGCPDQRIRRGGTLGGHVEVQIDTFYYGFNIKNKENFHRFARLQRKFFNSKMDERPVSVWREKTVNDKRTSMVIPVTPAEKAKLQQLYRKNVARPPYDYALVGMRCAPSAREFLGKSGVLPRKTRLGCLVSAFYPRQFRKKMVRKSEKKGWPVSKKEGIECRDWD